VTKDSISNLGVVWRQFIPMGVPLRLPIVKWRFGPLTALDSAGGCHINFRSMVMKGTLSILPDVVGLRRKAQSLAALDAIMSPNWQYLYYSFNSKWDSGEMMASRKNGSGDELYILFNSSGAILKGFDHESFMSPWARDDQSLWPSIFDGVPAVFEQFLKEPFFDIPNTTFCVLATE